MPSLIPEVFDRPGTHVLVIGVSAYAHFEGGTAPTQKGKRFRMRQLSAAARSASEFAAWMLTSYRNAAAPIASLRVLLSPSPGEQLAQPIADLLAANPVDITAIANNVRNELVAFRAVAGSRPDNVVVVYASGHGVQLSKNGAIVLLNDCGADTDLTELQSAIDMAGVHAGFNHPDTAQTQFWFVDACRQEPAMAERYETMVAGLTLDTKPGQARTNPVFLASSTQQLAYARPQGKTLFNEALMTGLAGAFAAPPNQDTNAWHVSVDQFTSKLGASVEALARAEQAEQIVDIGGKPTPAVFHAFEAPPPAEVDIIVMPPEVAVTAVGALSHRLHGKLLSADHVWPMHGHVAAGIYELQVDTDDHTQAYFDYVTVVPATFRHKVEFR